MRNALITSDKSLTTASSAARINAIIIAIIIPA